MIETEERLPLASTAPEAEPPACQLANWRRRHRKRAGKQLRHLSLAKSLHGSPDHRQAGKVQLIEQVLGAHRAEMQISRSRQPSAVTKCRRQDFADFLIEHGLVWRREKVALFHAQEHNANMTPSRVRHRSHRPGGLARPLGQQVGQSAGAPTPRAACEHDATRPQVRGVPAVSGS
jgi:hypothetical protein